MIYTKQQIETTPLFAALMREINNLHKEYGRPEGISGPTCETAGWDSTYGSSFTPDSDKGGVW